MGMTTQDWTLSRVNGTPVPIELGGDGYASYHIVTGTSASEYNLARNAVYRLVATTEDCFVSLLSLDDGDSSVSATTGMKVLKDTVVFITTTRERSVLSVVAGGAGTLQVVRMLSRSGR